MRMTAAARRILLVEDEAMIASYIEDVLLELGYVVVGPAAKLEAALALANAADVDGALLDVSLDGTPSFPVAERLRALGKPFIFATGYGIYGLPPDFAGTPTLQKPFHTAELAQAIGDLFVTPEV